MAKQEISKRLRAQIDAKRATLKKPRWEREGRSLKYDGSYAIAIERSLGVNAIAKLSPVECDAIADLLCRTLNEVDLDALTREWMKKP
jgi:hypothetical protein